MKRQKEWKGINIFCSYAQADQTVQKQLSTHMSQLKRNGLIEEWSEQQVLAGADRVQEIDHAIRSAHIILLLISADFLASDACYQTEMQHALERHKRGEAQVVPIIVRPCDWQHSPFAHLQWLPRNAKPLSASNKDAAFVGIVQELRKIITQQQMYYNQPAEQGSDDQVLYAGIFEQSDGPPWVAHHGSTSKQCQQIFDQLTEQGYRLVDRSGYGVNGQALYAGIFEQSDGPPWIAHRDLPFGQFQQTYNQLVEQGNRLVKMSGYGINGQALYAGIFEQSDGPVWAAHFGLPSEQFQQTLDQLMRQGYRLVNLSVYGVNGQALYAGIFEQSDGPPWIAHSNLTPNQFQQTFDQLTEQGYRLVDRCGYSVNNQILHAGIFEQSDGPLWRAHSGLTSDQFQQISDQLAGQDYRLMKVSGYGVSLNTM
jgi:Bacterial tandem repeat domain 1/TIR domain